MTKAGGKLPRLIFFAKFIPSLAGTDGAARIGWQLPVEEAKVSPSEGNKKRIEYYNHIYFQLVSLYFSHKSWGLPSLVQ